LKTQSTTGAEVKPVQSRSSFINNTSAAGKHSSKSNVWETPVRQKRVSMNASIPSSTNTVRPSSTHPTIKSEPKGPSEEFIKWCKISLRELKPGLNGM
jgi:hypothetical protein